MGRESRGTRFRKAPPGLPASHRLYHAAALKLKERDEIHEYDGGMAGMEDEFTFCPEISPRSERLIEKARKKEGDLVESDFGERLYKRGKKQLQRRMEKSRRPLFSFSPKTTKRARKVSFYNAITYVQVPRNNFGLPSDNRSLPKEQRIKWTCKRKPVPQSPVSHASRMYEEGLKKMQERDEAFLRREMDKDFSSCTFMPNINNPSAAAKSVLGSRNSMTSPNLVNVGTNPGRQSDFEVKDFEKTKCDASTQVGVAMLAVARDSATRLQSFGRTLSARSLYARKKESVTKIQKVLRGKQHRTKAQKLRQKRNEAREKVVQEQIRLRDAEAKKRDEEQRLKEEIEEKKRDEERRLKEEIEESRKRREDGTRSVIAQVEEIRKNALESESNESGVAGSVSEENVADNVAQAKEISRRPAEGTNVDAQENPSTKSSSALLDKKMRSDDETQQKKIADAAIDVRQRELNEIHDLIGRAYAACIKFRRESKDPSDVDTSGWGIPEDTDAVEVSFSDWFQEVFLTEEAEAGMLTVKMLTAETKQQVRKLHQDSSRIYWFGVLLGWLPSTKETPFSNDASDALLNVLTMSAATDPKLLCQRPCLVKEIPMIRAIKEYFEATENDTNEEVVKMLKVISDRYAFQQLVDLDKSMNLFLTTWYSLIGRFKAAWTDDMPPASASPANSPGGPG
eukprot:g612.t1